MHYWLRRKQHLSHADFTMQISVTKLAKAKKTHSAISFCHPTWLCETREVVAIMEMRAIAGFPFMFPEQSTLRPTCAWQAVKRKVTAWESHAGHSAKLFRTRMLSKESMDKQPLHIKTERDKAREEAGRLKEVSHMWPTAPKRASSISKPHKNPDHFQRGLWWVISNSPSHQQQITASV